MMTMTHTHVELIQCCGELASTLVRVRLRLARRLRHARDGVHGVGDLLQHEVAIRLGRRQLRMTHKRLRRMVQVQIIVQSNKECI